VVAALKRGEVANTGRFTGKTETLLAYIALHHDDAIVVCRDMNNCGITRRRWKYRYPLLREPRFLSVRQFETRSDGMTGTVFVDGVDLFFHPRAKDKLNPMLRFGGGVFS